MNPSELRHKILQLKVDREKVEKILIKRHYPMINASLLERYLGTRIKKRKTPAYYLCWAEKGKIRMKYVHLKDLEKISRKTRKWQEFSQAMSKWVKITTAMEKIFRRLGITQIDPKWEKEGKKSQ
jgi:succinyl-CoA synthetase beta subunit